MHFTAIIWKNLRRRSLRSVLTIGGIAVASGAFVALVGTTRNFEEAFLDLYQQRGADLVVQRGAGVMQLSNGVNETLGKRIAALPDVAQVIGGLMDLVAFEKFDLFAVIVNGWSADCPVLDRVELLSGRRLQAGDRGKVMLGETLAANIGKHVGDSVELYTQHYEVVGVFRSFSVYESGAVFMLLDEMQQVMDRPGQVTGYVVKLRPPTDAARVALCKRRIESLDATLAATATNEFVGGIKQIRILRIAAWVISLIAVMISGVGVANTLAMSALERSREIGILRAIGWRKMRVIRLILGEAISLCLAGSLLGSLGGVLLVRMVALTPACAGLIEGQVAASVVGQVVLVTLLTGLIGALYPAWWILRLRPVAALQIAH
jgi:putative ABC transport system permease protein